MDCIVPGVAKSWIRLSDFDFHFPLFVCKAPLSARCCMGEGVTMVGTEVGGALLNRCLRVLHCPQESLLET